MRGFALCATALAATFASAAPTQAPESIRQTVVYGNDPCPPSTDEEIVVCARKPETERYRIPEELRDEARKEDPTSEAWAARAQTLEYVGRTGIQSCSTVGPAGFTGCWEQMLRQAREERRAAAEGPER